MRITAFFFLLLLASGLEAQIIWDKYPEPVRNNQGKFVYRDSLGNALTGIEYDGAQPYYKGLAIVHKASSTPPGISAVINLKGEELIPYSKNFMRHIETGHIIVESDKKTLYDFSGRMIVECKDCDIFPAECFRHVTMQTGEYRDVPKIVTVMDYTGRVLFKYPGTIIIPLYQQTFKNGSTLAKPVPYYKVLRNPQPNVLTDIVTLEGKLVIDSLSFFTDFYNHEGMLIRNNKAALIDTSFREIIPFASGYELIRLLEWDPKKSYTVKKKGKFGLITRTEEVLIPFVVDNEIMCDEQFNGYYFYNEVKGEFYTVSFKDNKLEMRKRDN